MQYSAVVTREGAFTLAAFPDCPGCQTFVRGDEDIDTAAQEALEGWLEANLGREMVPLRPGTVSIPRGAEVHEITVPLPLAFRLELRWVRAEASKTQAQFGKQLGMSQQQYAKLEGTGSNPTLGTVQRVIDRVGVGFLLLLVGDRRALRNLYIDRESRAAGNASKAVRRRALTVKEQALPVARTGTAARRSRSSKR